VAFERQAAQNNPSRFPNSFFRGKLSFELISDSHDWLFAAPYLWFYAPISTNIPPFDSAKEIILTLVKCITNQQFSSDLWPLKDKRNCIVHKSLKIIKLIKNAIRLTLIVRIVVFLFFGRIPVDSSHFSLYFVSSLSPKYCILKVLMCSFNKRNCIVDK
jgi:hypothetical protein